MKYVNLSGAESENSEKEIKLNKIKLKTDK